MMMFQLFVVMLVVCHSLPSSSDLPSPLKISSESSLEEVFLDSPLTRSKQPHCNVMFVDSPDKHSISSSSSGGSYLTKCVSHGDETMRVNGAVVC